MKHFNKDNVQSWRISFLLIIILFSCIISCKKFITVGPPLTTVNSYVVFENDAQAASVLTGIYTELMKKPLTSGAPGGGGLLALSVFPGLSADELVTTDITGKTLFPYYSNSLLNTIPANADFWSQIYPIIYSANSAIEGLNNSKGISNNVKQQLLGEAKFVRAICYFYLVNLYGDVPLVLSTDFELNRLLPRTSKDSVWSKIKEDLLSAKSLLSEKYLQANVISESVDRVRPTTWAASALLARVYLYTANYEGAISESSIVINNNSLFGIVPLNEVFKMNSQEAIWQLMPVGSGVTANTREGSLFNLPSNGPSSSRNIYLSDYVVNSFSPDDQRGQKGNWINYVTARGKRYYYPYKYKIGAVNTSVQEYSMVLRLAELFLIRAESKAWLGDIPGAASDLDIIRNRAGLPNTTANDKETLLTANLDERQVELFSEWGHRWLDLKRTGIVDSVMSIVTPTKGGSWNHNWQFYPIRNFEILRSPNVTQNPGYE